MIILIIVFTLLSVLCLADTLGIIIRRVGFIIGEPLAGYSVQSFFSIGLRVINLCFMPVFAISLDMQIFKQHFLILGILFFITPALQILAFCHLDSFNRIYSIFLVKMKQDGGFSFVFKRKSLAYLVNIALKSWKPLLRGTYMKSKSEINYSCKTFLSASANINLAYKKALPAYVLFYSCWPLIAVASAIFPSNTAFILSLSSFLNGWSTIMTSVSIDPALLQLEEDYQKSTQAYSDFVLLRAIASSISFILIFLLCLYLHFFMLRSAI
jgi:hypothetical protein